MRSKWFWVLLCTGFMSNLGWAETWWTSPISNNAVMAKDGSPHRWTGEIHLSAGVTLTIEPGARILMQNGAGLVIDDENRLLAHGTITEPIIWGGAGLHDMGGEIRINSSNTCEFVHCWFSYMGKISITPYSFPGNPLFEHCVFQNISEDCIHLQNQFSLQSRARILHCIFDPATNNFGIHIGRQGNQSSVDLPTIQYCSFARNGLYLEHWGGGTNTFNFLNFGRDNRVAGGIGLKLYGHNQSAGDYRIDNIMISGYDFGNCQEGVFLDGEIDAIGNLIIAQSSLTQLNCSTNAAFPDGCNLGGNYWGTTDMNVISNMAFNGMLAGAISPISSTNLFPQADVDGSAGGNATGHEDAELVKRYVMGTGTLTPEQLVIADVDRDGTVTLRDALMIESYVNGLIWKLPEP